MNHGIMVKTYKNQFCLIKRVTTNTSLVLYNPLHLIGRGHYK